MQSRRLPLSWIIIAGLAIIAVILWFLAPTYPPHFSSFDATLANLGQIAGLVGAVLLSLNFILSTRLKSLEKIFKGLNDVYIKHELLGRIAVILLLAHPLLLISKYASWSLNDILGFLLPGKYWDVNYGILALAWMVILIVITLYLRPRYDIWKITHKFMGLALILAGLHIWLIPSHTATYLPLRFYILILIALAIAAYTYKTLLGWLVAPKIKMEVIEVKLLNHNVTEVTLKPKTKFDFESGQFCFISFDDKNLGRESHPFSFVSAPHESAIRIAIKDLGDYTKLIKQLKPGATAKVEGPFGIFNYKNSRLRQQIWIAGGIGITPFQSMAEDLLKRKADYEVDLFYAANDEEDAVYIDRLREISRELKAKFRVHDHFFNEKGFLSADEVNTKATGVKDKDIFICGPPKMMDMMASQLQQLGVEKEMLHMERFSL
ncbi:MAG: ferric reductase-like transmembrane domain-containing protein [Patescibacteria group bacterium]